VWGGGGGGGGGGKGGLMMRANFVDVFTDSVGPNTRAGLASIGRLASLV